MSSLQEMTSIQGNLWKNLFHCKHTILITKLRMKHTLTFLLLSGFVLIAYAQKLTGIVTLQNSGGKPIAGVTVEGDGATSSVSTEKGTFSVEYPTHIPGDWVRLSVRKEGYEVVNTADLYVKLPQKTSKELVKIYMCPKGEMHKRKERYYAIITQNVTKYYERQQYELLAQKEKLRAEIAAAKSPNFAAKIPENDYESQIIAIDSRLNALETTFETALKQAENHAYSMAAENFDEANDMRLAAFHYFEKSLWDSVKYVLNEDKIAERIAQAKAEKAAILSAHKKNTAEKITEIDKEISELIHTYLAKGFYANLMLDKEGEGRNCQKAVVADSMAARAMTQYATFLANESQTQAAILYQKRALALYKAENNLPKIAYSTSFLGTLSDKNGDSLAAEMYFNEALLLCRNLVLQNPQDEAYLSPLATCLHSLSFLAWKKHNITAAKKDIEESIGIYRKLVTTKPDVYNISLAQNLYDLGQLMMLNQNTTNAKRNFESSLDIYRELAKKNARIYARNIANNLFVLGNIAMRHEDNLSAQSYFEEALPIFREKAGDSKELAYSLRSLGQLSFKNKDTLTAIKYNEDALPIVRKLAEREPDAYLPDLAATLNKLTYLHFIKKDTLQAKKIAEESLQIDRNLAANEPTTYLPMLLDGLNRAAYISFTQKKITEAQKMYEEALPIAKKLAVEQPDMYLSDVFSSLYHLGYCAYEEKKAIEGKKYFEEAITISAKIPVEERNYRLEIAMLNTLITQSKDTNDIVSVKRYYEEILPIYKKMAEKEPTIYLSDWASTLYNYGVFLYKNESIVSAEKYYTQSLNIYRKLAEDDPDTYLSIVAIVLKETAKTSQDKKEARKELEESLSIYRKLAEKNPDDYLLKVSNLLNNLSVFLNYNKETEVYLTESLQICRKLVAINPKLYSPDLAHTLNFLGIERSLQGDSASAKKYHDESLAIYQKLCAENQNIYATNVVQVYINLAHLYRIAFWRHPSVNNYQMVQKYFEEAKTIAQKTYLNEYLQNQLNEFQSFFDKTGVNDILIWQKIVVAQTDTDEAKTPTEKAKAQAEVVQLKAQIAQNHPQDRVFALKLADDYGNLAWILLLNKDFWEAEQAARKGLSIDKSKEWIHIYLAHALLFQGKYIEAETLYNTYKDKLYTTTTYKERFLADFIRLEKEGITHGDVAKIRAELE